MRDSGTAWLVVRSPCGDVYGAVVIDLEYLMGRAAITIAAVALLGLSGCSSEPEPTDVGEQAETSSDGDEAESQELPPLSIDLDGCTPASEEQAAAIEATFVDERADALRLVYAASAGDRVYVAGSSYRPDGSRLYSSDVWAIEGGEVFALSSSAQEISDAGEVESGAFATPEAALVEACASDALLPEESRRFVDNLDG